MCQVLSMCSDISSLLIVKYGVIGFIRGLFTGRKKLVTIPLTLILGVYLWPLLIVFLGYRLINRWVPWVNIKTIGLTIGALILLVVAFPAGQKSKEEEFVSIPTVSPSPPIQKVETSSPTEEVKEVNKVNTPVPKTNLTAPNQPGSCVYSCSGPDRDCADFSSHQEAQNFFNCCGFTVTNDPMRLDSVGVGDGIACEGI